jgi:eukaryotic-like serine/threonine-protein kinase
MRRHLSRRSALREARSRATMTPAVSNPLAPIPRPHGQGTVCPKGRRHVDDDAVGCAQDHAPLVKATASPVGADDDPMVGRTLDGRFTILAKLGAGSMGTVYRARQRAVERDVAIKILRSDRATNETAKARFLREARANSLLASPHTVTVFDFGQGESGEFYLAMEMLEGESLGQRLQRVRRLPVDIAVETARQALRSLAEAHAKGIVHRDLKPDNLFYARVKHGQHDVHVEEIVKVLDFGIAKMIDTPGGMALNALETQAGTVFGTPRYMSPEQAQGKPLDARSDLYSLGVILYQMLTGRPPFTDSDAVIVMARHIKTIPKLPIEACPEANIPVELEAALMRTLAKEPALRPSSAEQMSSELARALDLDTGVTSGVRTVRSAPSISAPAEPVADPVPAPFLPSNRSSVSMPPELVPSRRGPLVALGVAAAMTAAVVGLITGQQRRSTSAPMSHTTAAVLSAPVTGDPSTATPWAPPSDERQGGTDLPTASPQPATVSDVDAPTVSAESLPRARAPRPRATFTSRPGVAKAPPSASANKVTPPVGGAPAPPPSSRYGIFE